MSRILAIVAALALCLSAGAQDTNFAFRLPCELQTAGPASLTDLTWQQGTTPHIAVSPLRLGRPMPVDQLTAVRMIVGHTGMVTNYAVATNWLATNGVYYVQFPTVGTNSAGTNATAQAWWYTVHFERDGRRYWTGDGRLYIEPTTSTAEDGLAWREITAGAATDLVARAQIAALSNVVEGIEVGEVPYGIYTNTAYRGDWGDIVSNLVRTVQAAASNAAEVAAAALPAVDAATNYVPRYLSGWWSFGGNGLVTIFTNLTVNGTFKVRKSRVLRESTLTDSQFRNPIGSPWFDPGFSIPLTLSSNAVSPRTNSNGHTRMVIITTNLEGRSSGSIQLKVDGQVIIDFMPTCNGAAQTNDYPYVTSNSTVEFALNPIPNPLSNSAPVITSLKFWTLADPTQAAEPFIDTKDQRIGGDDATLPRQWVNKQTMEASDDAVFDLLFAEVEDRTTATDYHGNPVTWNARYTQTTLSNSIVHKFSGQTYMRVDGEGAAVTPEIKAFSVASGEIATMTVWSYSGGATNLLPEYCTDLVAAVWTRLSNSVVSATNVDDYTAQVVFTNSLDRMAFFRLVDTSGGTGVPVVNFYGAVGINGDVQTAWPAGGEGSGISAATATSIAQRVIGAAPASAFSNVTFGATATVMCATGTWYDAATRTAYTTSCPSGTGGGISASDATNISKAVAFDSGLVPFVLTSAPTVTITRLTATNLYALTLTNAAVVLTIQTNDWPTSQVGRITVEVTKGTNTLGFDTATITNSTVLDIATNRPTPLYFRRPAGQTLWGVRQ